MGGKIYFNGSIDDNQKAYHVLAAIDANPVGQVIVSRIRNSDRNLTIAPYDGRDCNAKTHPENPEASAPKGVSSKSDAPNGPALWYRGRDDDPSTRNIDERFNVVVNRVGTGKGSDVIIYFTPDKYGKSGCHGGMYGSLADEVLFHEMVHGLRQILGKYNQIPTGDSFTGYGNEEEFLAIVATNVYMSAKGSTQLRAGHDGHLPLKPPLDTSAGFLTDAVNLKLMNIYRLIWADAFLGMSNVVTAKFNPFRELTVNGALQLGTLRSAHYLTGRWR